MQLELGELDLRYAQLRIVDGSRLIGDIYFCRSATTRTAGPGKP